MDLREIVAEIAGQPVEALERIEGEGYTITDKWVARLKDGSKVFAKQAADAATAEALRYEHQVYVTVKGPPLPALVGLSDGERPVLVRENLEGEWLTRWTPETVAAVGQALEQAGQIRPGSTIRPISYLLADWGWPKLDRKAFAGLKVCTPQWLDQAYDRLVATAAEATTEGEALMHMDLRVDNVCLLKGRTVLVDWDHASRGNPRLDRVLWLISLPLAEGPEPWEVMPDADPGEVAVMVGYIGSQAYLEPPPGVVASVRQLQTRQVDVGLRWLARLLDLPQPR